MYRHSDTKLLNILSEDIEKTHLPALRKIRCPILILKSSYSLHLKLTFVFNSRLQQLGSEKDKQFTQIQSLSFFLVIEELLLHKFTLMIRNGSILIFKTDIYLHV